MRIEIPGREPLEIQNLLLDYNGTIAKDGKIPEALYPKLRALALKLNLIILTADTYGTVEKEASALGLQVRRFPRENAAREKYRILKEQEGQSLCIGNGFNDIEMCREADLAFAVLDAEGMAARLLPHCDVLCRSSAEALDLLLNPRRLIATLRS